MSPLDYPQAYQDLYAVHQCFVQLGFDPNEVFVAVRDVLNQKNVLCAVLRSQGKEFVFTVVPLGEDIVEREVYAKWAMFVETAAVASPEVHKRLWGNSILGQHKEVFVGLAQALILKGFSLPKVEELRAHA